MMDISPTTRRAEICVAPRLGMHVDASRGAFHARPCVAGFVKFVVLALSVIILFDFLRTSSSSSSSSMGRKARGGVRCQTFYFCSLFPV